MISGLEPVKQLTLKLIKIVPFRYLLLIMRYFFKERNQHNIFFTNQPFFHTLQQNFISKLSVSSLLMFEASFSSSKFSFSCLSLINTYVFFISHRSIFINLAVLLLDILICLSPIVRNLVFIVCYRSILCFSCLLLVKT